MCDVQIFILLLHSNTFSRIILYKHINQNIRIIYNPKYM